MEQCVDCADHEVIKGIEAEDFKKRDLVKVDWKDSGWTFIPKCKRCPTYWKLTWEDGYRQDPGRDHVEKKRRLPK